MTNHSIGESVVQISKLIAKAKSLNMKALALTDNTLSGALEFYRTCIKNDIKPIIGQKILYDDTYLILLCKDFEAYKFLCKHSQSLDPSKRHYSKLPFTREECSHFICITQEYNSKYLQDLFGDNLYAEILFHKIKENEINFMNLFENLCNTQAVITNPVRFIEKYDYKLLTAYREALNLQHLEDVYNNYLVDYSEIQYFLEHTKHLELVENSKRIADEILFIFPEKYFTQVEANNRIIESFPDFDNAEQQLQSLVYESLKKHASEFENFNKASERMKYELKDIIANHFEKFFLFQWKLSLWCSQAGIEQYSGNSAAGGSLVAYLLGITNVNPLQYGLLYECFLNTKLKKYPYFYIAYESTDKVIKLLKEKYGYEHIALINTPDFINPKQAFLADSKSLNMANEEFVRLTDKLKGLRESNGIYTGYVITKEPVYNYIPVLRDENHDELYCEYSFDLPVCGVYENNIHVLKELEKLKLISEKVGNKFNYKSILLDDENTFKAFSKGNTDDVFQFESSDMQKILKDFKPTCFTDIVLLYAIYKSNLHINIPIAIKNKNNGYKISEEISAFDSILTETYGLIVYQEQVMQISHEAAGYSYKEADILRRILGKKKYYEIMEKKTEFTDLAIQKGIITSKNQAEKLFDHLFQHSGYSFPKSHAVAYTMLSYWDMYLKVHYTKEYKEVLNSISYD